MDVKNAFLNGNLQEEVYMHHPSRFVSQDKSLVCRLRKEIYGLKQAPRTWFKHFRDVILATGFTQSKHNHSMFIRTTKHEIYIILLYVDDILISGNDFSSIKNKYALDLVSSARLNDAKVVDIPMELNVKLFTHVGDPLLEPTMYRKLVSSLIYLTMTRPDIAYVVHVVNQFISDPRRLHLSTLHPILYYVRGTSIRGLFFDSTSSLDLSAYADADWAGDLDTCRSTTGYCVFLGSSLISWKSKKHDTISKLSIEVEYRAMSSVANEIVWVRALLNEFGISISNPTPLYADNQSVIKIVSNPVFHERTKHINIDCHYICDRYLDDTLSLLYVSSTAQTTDIFTKFVTRSRHNFLVDKLMLYSCPH
ncbi:uncharacterized protein LOC110007719 [Amborella trichopoda]|uniref:uncharacterized protein LOC110007719 n=1 Tax=Amborella trichopoda TaxID=13333 RepID=UPI0009BF6E59|nr:uncharacterized protein LOC110007719 [Amborella trichopoda]|eukprot:XP_020526104.1 uncharacterized protein LOC110007719 [Amborella trichopoda]